MKRLALLLLTFTALSAQAGVSIRIEHPRYPSKQKDLYKVKCEDLCEVAVDSNESVNGKLRSKDIEAKIREIFSLHEKGELPKARDAAGPKVLYEIQVKDGEKNLSLILSYPKSYLGNEFTRYSNLVSLIEDIKRAATDPEELK